MPYKPRNGVSTTEVAKACGVSVMTVSRALHLRTASIAQETIEKIRKVAGDMGYRCDHCGTVTVLPILLQAYQQTARFCSGPCLAGFSQGNSMTLWQEEFEPQRNKLPCKA